MRKALTAHHPVLVPAKSRLLCGHFTFKASEAETKRNVIILGKLFGDLQVT